MEKRMQFLQYLNTVLLTLVFGCAMMIFLTLKNVSDKEASNRIDIELLKAETTVIKNTTADHEVRIDALEKNFTDNLKAWIENNYMRKPQVIK